MDVHRLERDVALNLLPAWKPAHTDVRQVARPPSCRASGFVQSVLSAFLQVKENGAYNDYTPAEAHWGRLRRVVGMELSARHTGRTEGEDAP
jgi:hypothetical protein